MKTTINFGMMIPIMGIISIFLSVTIDVNHKLDSASKPHVTTEDIKNIVRVPINQFLQPICMDETTFFQRVSSIQNKIDIRQARHFLLSSNIPSNRKDACFKLLATLESSYDYWQENSDEWLSYLQENVEMEYGVWNDIKKKLKTTDWNQVVFSDAYYAWFGTVSSGGNLIVGAGAAAVGSIFSAL